MSTLKSKLALQLSKSESSGESNEDTNGLILVPETTEQSSQSHPNTLVQVVPEFALSLHY